MSKRKLKRLRKANLGWDKVERDLENSYRFIELCEGWNIRGGKLEDKIVDILRAYKLTGEDPLTATTVAYAIYLNRRLTNFIVGAFKKKCKLGIEAFLL